MARDDPEHPTARPRGSGIRSGRLSLTRQLLLFQLSLIALVLIAVTAISLEQSRSSFESGSQRRMLTVAEYTAANPLVRSLLDNDAVPQQFSVPVEALRTTTGVDQLLVTDAAGRVIASPADPRLVGSVLAIDPTPDTSDAAWAGVAPIGANDNVVAQVPVLSNSGEVVGTVVAARRFPAVTELLASAAPNLLVYVGVAGVLGVAGSLLLAARVKRQTLGLEPEQIGRLVEHRDAMIHGIREGVIAVDTDGLITLANDSARTLLGLPADAEGRAIDTVGLDEEAVRALRRREVGAIDTVFVNRGVLLVLNQTLIHPPRSRPEVVTTLRDRTELVTLQHDLGSSRQATDTLRAQTHEFANRLHTISMLMQLGDTEAAVEYVDAVTRDRTELDNSVLTRLQEPAVAALVIAKTSLARERGATLVLSPESALARVDGDLSTDLVTVIGNLVDNALDAVTGALERNVRLDVQTVSGSVRVTVSDSGPGIDAALIDRVFEVGVSSKSLLAGGDSHGYGLAIVRLVATRRGGSVGYRADHGAVFEAVLPVAGARSISDQEQTRV
ncbi:GHKL domain-containing protein [Cryobacterium sp. TMT1-3]|uniref:histidine kinase n=1 Tax=Cryobacterium luteum TaxID=1424661 RepID=A0A1H8LMF5_9MICO|nr:MULTISPECIES: ATP-binding protein [Cryobacterium]TFB83246.1 GHKL domain-containing protein [Cryobacterium luteum]TFC31258.1 GHKL domain-containing protein [Cryobacterium sp. TMT1-3]SEO06193.1 Sensor histidine kinase regulating citrate/malate metabolism [Cryobacterium luteum]